MCTAGFVRRWAILPSPLQTLTQAGEFSCSAIGSFKNSSGELCSGGGHCSTSREVLGGQGGRGGGFLPVEAWPLLAHPLGAKSIIDWLATVTPLQSVSKRRGDRTSQMEAVPNLCLFLGMQYRKCQNRGCPSIPTDKNKRQKKTTRGCWLDGTSITFKMGKSDSSVPVKPVSHGYRIPMGGEARHTIYRLFSCVELKSCRSQTGVEKKPSWFFLFYYYPLAIQLHCGRIQANLISSSSAPAASFLFSVFRLWLLRAACGRKRPAENASCGSFLTDTENWMFASLVN